MTPMRQKNGAVEQGAAAGREDDDRTPVVRERQGDVFADSRDVARVFARQHKDVLRSIRKLISSEPILGRRNFAPFKINDLTGESTSHYEMDRDGFTLLAMSFTGAQALRWKLRYIEAFNAMEARLRLTRQRQGVDEGALLEMLDDPETLRRMLGRYADRNQALLQQVEEMSERTSAYERLTKADGSVCITDAAKQIGCPPRRLFAWMRRNRWIYTRASSRADVAYQERIRQGVLEHRMRHVTLESGEERAFSQVVVTPAGIARLLGLMPGIAADIRVIQADMPASGRDVSGSRPFDRSGPSRQSHPRGSRRPASRIESLVKTSLANA